MNVTSIRVGRTWNLGNYESKKVEFEATFENGETFETGLAGLTAIVEAQNPTVNGAAVEKKAKPAAKSTTPPLKGKGTTDANGVTPPATVTTTASPTTEEPPFTPGQDIVAEPVKKEKGRPKKSSVVLGVDELLPSLKQKDTVAGVLGVFNEMRSVADRTKGKAADEWEYRCKEVAGHVRSLPGHSEQEGYADLYAAFDAEKEALVKARV